MNVYWVWDAGRPRPARSRLEYLTWRNAVRPDSDLPSGMHVAYTKVTESVVVSTVFLSIAHGFDGGLPLLFETMIFAPEYPEIHHDARRYTSITAAERGHAALVERVRALLATKPKE